MWDMESVNVAKSAWWDDKTYAEYVLRCEGAGVKVMIEAEYKEFCKDLDMSIV